MSGKYKNNRLWKVVSLASVMSAGVMLASCGGDDSGSSGSSKVNEGSVSVLTSPKSSGSGLAYQLTVVSDFTNADGYARVDNLPVGDRLIFNVGRQDYALQTFVTGLNEKESRNYVPVDILPIAEDNSQVTDFNHVDGVTVSKNDAKIVIPSDALRRNDGAKITRQTKAFLTDIDLSDKTSKYLPADLKSDDEGNTALEAVAAIHVQVEELEDTSDPSRLQTTAYRLGLNDLMSLKTDQTMSVTLPVRSANPPQTIDLYNFNNANAYWTKDLELTLNADQTAYTGTTNKTGYLAAMLPITDTVTITGCVERVIGSKTEKAERASVSLFGQSYYGYDQTLADSSGNFTLVAKRGSSVKLTSQVDQYAQEIELNNLTADTVVNSGSCISIDTSGSESNVNGELTWTGSKNYDINVLLPNGAIMDGTNRIIDSSAGSNGVAVEIKEDTDGNSENITYSALMKGDHLIAVKNVSGNYNPGISGSNTSLVLSGTTFQAADVPGEISQRDSKIVDRRTNMWIAAVMHVKPDCSVTISSPAAATVDQNETLKYKSWITDSDFVGKKVFVDNTKNTFNSSGAVYCQKPSS